MNSLTTISLSIVTIILFYGCETETQTSKKEVSKILPITSNSVGDVSLGMDWNKFITRSLKKYKLDTLPNSYFNLEGGGNGLLVSEGHEKMFFIYNKFPDSTRVGGIVILSDRCRTSEGVYIGMKLDDLVNIFPDLNLRPNLAPPPQEVFNPSKYQVTKNKKNYSIFTIGIQSNDGKLLGKYKDEGDYLEEGTQEYNTNGYVATIELHRY